MFLLPLSTTEQKPLSFSQNELSQKFRSQANRVGWLHSKSDKPGVKFDLIIKDALGRERLRKLNCGNETDRYGEKIDLPVMVGEDFDVVIENFEGAEKLDIFLN